MDRGLVLRDLEARFRLVRPIRLVTNWVLTMWWTIARAATLPVRSQVLHPIFSRRRRGLGGSWRPGSGEGVLSPDSPVPRWRLVFVEWQRRLTDRACSIRSVSLSFCTGRLEGNESHAQRASKAVDLRVLCDPWNLRAWLGYGGAGPERARVRVTVMWDFLTRRRSVMEFTPFERAVLDSVTQALAQSAQDRFRAQLRAINHVQRFAKGKEVNLYCLRQGRPCFPEKLLFPLRDELELARVEFTVDRDEQSTASVRMVNGRIFSLVFARSPHSSVHRQAGVYVTRVRLWTDPSVPNSARVDGMSEGDNRSLRVASPAPSDHVQLAWRHQLEQGCVDARMPQDYLEVLGTPVLQNGFVVHDPTHLRLIATNACNFYILAEKEGLWGFGVIQGSDDGELYCLDFESGAMSRVGLSLAFVLCAQALDPVSLSLSGRE